MAVKGITIKIGAETNELDKAISDIDKKTASLDKELKKVNKALHFNPTSVELWRQKQTILNEKISQTKDRLANLKKQQEQMNANKVSHTSKEYRTLQREIVETESKLKTFKGQLNTIGNARLKALSEGFKQAGDKMKTVGRTMTQNVTVPIVAGYTAAMKYASDYEENLNKLDVAFGKNSQSVKDWAKTAGKEFGLSQVQATESASAFGALGKGIGLSEKESAKMSMSLAGLSADLGSYFNVGVDESSKALEGIFTGESEALKKFGVVMTDTNLKDFAADQGLVWKEMSQTEKTQLRYNYVLAKTKDAQGDFSRTSDGTANSMKIFQAAVQDLLTAIGTHLLPVITPVVQKITEWINKFQQLSPETQKIITIIGLVAAAIGPVLVILGTLSSAIGAILGAIGTVGSAISAIGPVIAALSGPIGWVVAACVAAVAAGVALWKNWDKVKAAAISLGKKVVAAWNSLKARTQSIFNAIKATATSIWTAITGKISGAVSKITEPVKKAVSIVKSAISTIKKVLSGKISLPHIKLPHFSISGKFSLDPPSIPKIGVKWYANGGIFRKATLAGIGEAGPEAVVPLDKLYKKLDAIALASTSGVVVNVYGAPGMDVNELAAKVQARLVLLEKQKVKAWGY